MTSLHDIMADLTAEADDLDRLLDGLDDITWTRPTPAPGWTITHQVAHLTGTFRLARLAAADPEAFRKMLAQLSDDFDANVAGAMAPFLSDSPDVLFKRWQAERASAVRALAGLPPDQPVPWLVRPLPPAVLASAGMMELFGHGQDIRDTLGVRGEPTDRLRHLVGFAVATWDFGYLARDIDVPAVALRFDVTSPAGDMWSFGPADSGDRISGPAEDLCLLVTRRRHPDDLALTASGQEAQRWLGLAQAYRGPAGDGRTAGQFAS